MARLDWTLAFMTGAARAELYFGHPDPAVNLARLEAVRHRHQEIEALVGEVVHVDDLPGKTACRIDVRLPGAEVEDVGTWPAVQAWMLDRMARLREAVETTGGLPAHVLAGGEPEVDEPDGEESGDASS